MFATWKKNTFYISLMQIILLIVNFFLITIISREYGAEIYGEYASAKSLSVLLGTVTVLSLALVVTRTSANVENFDKNLFYTTYKTIIRNTILACFLVVPLSALFGRNSIYVFIFLIGFVFNEMLHVALAYHQSKGDFVISSKQIIIRTILYGIGGWLIIYFQYSIFWIIVFQTIILIIFYFVAHSSLPAESSPTENNYSTKDLTSSGRKMVLTTFAAALLSELDIVILGVFYSGPILGVLAWSKRILEGLYQLVGASLDIVFPEISKLKNKNEITSIRSKLRIVILISLFIPIAYVLLEDIANNVFINVLGAEFENLASIFSVVIFSLPFMLWSRINIIFARAMHYEVNLFKVISAAAFSSFLLYYINDTYNYFSIEYGILGSQILFSLFTSFLINNQIKKEKDA
jgi:O-antigen/teichoic acid export membrane protein